MAVYQVAVIFNAPSDEVATSVAEGIRGGMVKITQEGEISETKLSFTKFEKEATEVADV